MSLPSETASQQAHLQYHPKLHREWGYAHLYFLRLGFAPMYRRNRVLEDLRIALDDYDVTSFAIYELMGLHDLLLRVWLPNQHSIAEFKDHLREKLARQGLQGRDHFAVDTTLRHWVWDDGNGGLRVPPPQLPRLSNDEIRDINSGAVAEDLLEVYKANNILASTPSRDGIKFMVVVTVSATISAGADDGFRDRLCGLLDQASALHEKSLYEGSSFGRFVILARVEYADFHQVSRELTEEINNIGMPETFGARTYTFPIATKYFLEFQDQLPLAKSAPKPAAESQPAAVLEQASVESYLRGDEDVEVEIKGSALVDLTPVLAEGASPQAVDWVTDTGVLKAVVALLNTDGGSVVVGAVERKHYPNPASSVSPFLSGCPELGGHLCIGLEPDIGTKGDWDGYVLRVRQKLTSRIRPDPGSLFRITKATVEDRLLAVISVLRPPPDEFFWAYPKSDKGPAFYIREDNMSRPLSGPEGDAYRQRKRLQRG